LSLAGPALSNDDQPPWDDERLVREFLRTGGEDLFAALVRRYKDKVMRLAVSVMGPSFSEEAEEIVQETFLTVHRQLDRFRFDGRFGTWLYRIAYNRAVDWRRRPRFRSPHGDESELAGRPSPEGNPLASAVEQQRRERLISCVDRLTEPHRSVVLLHYWMECSVSEIAEYLELNPSTVKSHLHRARQRLARTIKGKV
jgi:RNA polymerase sigma-70 factor (ECF subfamily)